MHSNDSTRIVKVGQLRRFLGQIIATIMGFACFAVFSFGPLFLFLLFLGFSIDDPLPRGSIMFLILGAVIAIPASIKTLNFLLIKISRYSDEEIREFWKRR